jgi:hypothetical protein
MMRVARPYYKGLTFDFDKLVNLSHVVPNGIVYLHIK